MNQATLDYVRQHADDDVRMLALRGCKDSEVDLTLALQQIAGRQTARHKLPTWAATEGLLYPPHLSMEQCSSEQTALYKQRIAARLCREAQSLDATARSLDAPAQSLDARAKRLVDLTGGFGVDFSFMSQAFDHAVYVEQQEALCQVARHNFGRLGLSHAEVVCADAAAYLEQMAPATVIFIDPARRDAHGSRTYGISDCTPDVLALRQQLLAKSRYVLLKLSPMLDWRKAVSDLGPEHVSEVHIVSVRGECKELLLVVERQARKPLRLVCINDEQCFETTDALDIAEATDTIETTEEIISFETSPYLYEPNASLMQAGCFSALARRFGLRQLAPNSHLFVSSEPITDFPGRSFHIDVVTTMNKKELRHALQGMTQANITVRNFPLSVAELRKRLKLSEGGSNYLFATTLAKGLHVLIVCSRL